HLLPALDRDDVLMAKKAAKKPTKGGRPAPAGKGAIGGNPTSRLAIALGGCVLIFFSIPTLVLMFAGLLPTLAAALSDRSRSRSAWICGGGLNFSGLAPSLLKLWFGHHEITYALMQVTNLRVMLLAWTSAALGWLLYYASPPVVITFMAATSKRRAATLNT